MFAFENQAFVFNNWLSSGHFLFIYGCQRENLVTFFGFLPSFQMVSSFLALVFVWGDSIVFTDLRYISLTLKIRRVTQLTSFN